MMNFQMEMYRNSTLYSGKNKFSNYDKGPNEWQPFWFQICMQTINNIPNKRFSQSKKKEPRSILRIPPVIFEHGSPDYKQISYLQLSFVFWYAKIQHYQFFYNGVLRVVYQGPKRYSCKYTSQMHFPETNKTKIIHITNNINQTYFL